MLVFGLGSSSSSGATSTQDYRWEGREYWVGWVGEVEFRVGWGWGWGAALHLGGVGWGSIDSRVQACMRGECVCGWMHACWLTQVCIRGVQLRVGGSEGVPVGKHMRRRKLGCESCCIVVVCECGNRRVTYEQAVLPNEKLDILLVRLFV